MPRSTKNQWDFGELFPPSATRTVLSVSEVTGQIKRALEKQVGEVWVTGEITNLRLQSSGHCYFALKDANAQLSCVLFRGEAVQNRDALRDGQKVTLQGALTVYEPRGQYQLRVAAVELEGIGALQLAFERLKQKLNNEGLFATERKRPLPRYAQRIGLVTSPTGAAIRDVLHVIERRHPGLEIVLVPCRVQGQGAAEEIAAAVRLLNEFSTRPQAKNKLDLILVTRGGGSLEDLWAFNEEVVARALFDSAVPVVSAVGHEIDFTISDFVADVRAATPSVAAELITEGVFASRTFVADAPQWMRQRVTRHLAARREDLAYTYQQLTRLHPRRRLETHQQQLDDLQIRLARGTRGRWRETAQRWSTLQQRFLRLRPGLQLTARREELTLLQRRQIELARHGLQRLQQRVESATGRLRLLSPQNVLDRGYSITTDAATGKIIRTAAETKPGQRLQTRVSQGTLISRVESTGE